MALTEVRAHGLDVSGGASPVCKYLSLIAAERKTIQKVNRALLELERAESKYLTICFWFHTSREPCPAFLVSLSVSFPTFGFSSHFYFVPRFVFLVFGLLMCFLIPPLKSTYSSIFHIYTILLHVHILSHFPLLSFGLSNLFFGFTVFPPFLFGVSEISLLSQRYPRIS